MSYLKDNGVDAGLLAAGLAGSLMLMSKTAGLNPGRTVLATVGGAASANYVTPLILHLTKLDHDTYSYSVAFLLGFAGLRAIEKLTQLMLPNESANTRKRTR